MSDDAVVVALSRKRLLLLPQSLYDHSPLEETVMHDDDDIHGERGTFLSVVLSIIMGCGLLFASFVVCGGLSFYIVGVVAGLAVFGYIHYLLWGQSMTEEVAGEREEQEARELLEGHKPDERWWDEPYRHRRS